MLEDPDDQIIAVRNLCVLTNLKKLCCSYENGDEVRMPDDPYTDSVDEANVMVVSRLTSPVHIAVVHVNRSYA